MTGEPAALSQPMVDAAQGVGNDDAIQTHLTATVVTQRHADERQPGGATEPGAATTHARPAQVPARQVERAKPPDVSGAPVTGWLPGLSIWLAAAAALLAAAGSVVGLVQAAAIYGQETVILADQAAAQDLVNLLLVAPLIVVLGWRVRRGHLGAYFGWLGCLGFTVYNYAIYAFSIHFGPLFLVWVAVLGLSVFALLGSLATVDARAIHARLVGRSLRWPGWFLIVAAALFALLWLREILPDLLAQRPSRSASQWNTPTNPVYVLDLAVFLPAVATSGVLLLRRHRWGYATAAAQLTWLALTCLPIMVTPFVANARGHEPGWAITAPVGLVLLMSLTTLGWLLRAARPAGRSSETLRPTLL